MAPDPLGTTHQLSDNEGSTLGTAVRVTVLTANTYMEQSQTVPNIFKIDVEGFEYDVFKGMKKLLAEPKLMAVFCEVHFALLENCGQKFAPIDIERLLRGACFDVKYTDTSHIQAIRRSC